MAETTYISAKVPHNIKRAIDAIAAQHRMVDGSDVRRSELIREALATYIEMQMEESDTIKRAVEEAINADDDAS